MRSARLTVDRLSRDRGSYRFVHDSASNESRDISCAETRRRRNITKVTRRWVRNIDNLLSLLLFNNRISYFDFFYVSQDLRLLLLLVLLNLSLFLLKKLSLLVICSSENYTCERVLLEFRRTNNVRQFYQQVGAKMSFLDCGSLPFIRFLLDS